MIIKITECEANYGGKDLFADLAEYNTILDWVKALIDGTANYTPLDCWVRIDENTVFFDSFCWSVIAGRRRRVFGNTA